MDLYAPSVYAPTVTEPKKSMGKGANTFASLSLSEVGKPGCLFVSSQPCSEDKRECRSIRKGVERLYIRAVVIWKPKRCDLQRYIFRLSAPSGNIKASSPCIKVISTNTRHSNPPQDSYLPVYLQEKSGQALSSTLA